MKFYRLDYILCLLLIFAVLYLTPKIFNFDMFEPLRNSLSGFRITDIVDSKIIDRAQYRADTNIVIINTEINFRQISNLELAKAVLLINQCNPKVIAVKKIISKSEKPKPNRILAQVLGTVDNLVLSSRLKKYNAKDEKFYGIERSDEMFRLNATEGFDNFLKDEKEEFEAIRKFVPYAEVDNENHTSFSLRTIELFDSSKANEFYERGKNEELIKYLGKNHFFKLELLDVLSNNFSPELFENRIVILGGVNTGPTIDSTMALRDVYFTPLNDRYTGKSFPDMHGTLIHANIMSMILRGDYLNSLPTWAALVIAVFLVYLNNVIFNYIYVKNKKWYEILSLGVFVVESLAILGATIISFIHFDYEMNLTLPIFAIALSILIFEMYNSSLKPMTINIYYKLYLRSKK